VRPVLSALFRVMALAEPADIDIGGQVAAPG
jgi:hypothetical protein